MKNLLDKKKIYFVSLATILNLILYYFLVLNEADADIKFAGTPAFENEPLYFLGSVILYPLLIVLIGNKVFKNRFSALLPVTISFPFILSMFYKYRAEIGYRYHYEPTKFYWHEMPLTLFALTIVSTLVLILINYIFSCLFKSVMSKLKK